MKSSPAHAPVTVRDRVWWSDVDKMGVMYFGRYLRFAEMAETEFFRALGFTYDGLASQHGIWLARVRLEADYRCPAKLDDELVCRPALTKIGASSMRFAYAVERSADDTRLADVTLTLACVDCTSLRATRIPEPLLTALRTRLAPAA